MLAELVDHVIGVDPDRDWITASSRSPAPTTTNPPATTATRDAPKERPTAKSDAASSATSPAESGASSSILRESESPLDTHRRLTSWSGHQRENVRVLRRNGQAGRISSSTRMRLASLRYPESLK